VNCNTFVGEGVPEPVAEALGDAGVCAG
jgi:hypothetical protein